MSPIKTDPPPGVCPDCGATIGVVILGRAVNVVNPPYWDEHLGWIAPPHVCGASLERVRRDLAETETPIRRRPADRPTMDEMLGRIGGPKEGSPLEEAIRDSIGDGITEEEADELLAAAARGELEPVADPHRPRLFRWPVEATRGHPNGSAAGWRWGCYFPLTDLCVNDMGNRGTGRPESAGLEWM